MHTSISIIFVSERGLGKAIGNNKYAIVLHFPICIHIYHPGDKTMACPS